MGDTFGESFNRALNMAHTLANNRRMEEAAQYQNTMQQLQFAKLAEGLQRGAGFRQDIAPLIGQKDEKGNEVPIDREKMKQAILKWYPEKAVALLKEESPQLGYHIEKESIGDQQTQDYRVFVDKGGNVVRRDPVGKPYKNTEGITQLRVQAFGSVPTATPGIGYDRSRRKFFEVNENGVQRDLSSDEVMQRNLQYKEEIPTNDIRVMQQSVPSVLQLSRQTREILDKSLSSLGPAASRWRELWSGKVGTADPEFRKLKTATSLLTTRLMKMHLGARGSEYFMQHFKELMDSAKDSPENLKAALDEIESYANEVGLPIAQQRELVRGGATATVPSTAGNIPPVKLLKEGTHTSFKNGQTWTLRNGNPVRIK